MMKRYRLAVSRENIRDQEEDPIREMVLAELAICMALMKIAGLLYYIMLLILVYMFSSGIMSTVLKVMLAVVLPFQVFHAILLVYGVSSGGTLELEDEKQVSGMLWSGLLGILLSIFVTVLGLCGTIHFILVGNNAIHYFVAFLFSCLICSICSMLTDFDIIIMVTRTNMNELFGGEERSTPSTPSAQTV